MMRLNWSLPCVHTTKLVNCKYANIFFCLSFVIQEFCWNIKGLKVVGQIQLLNKYMKEMFVLKIKTDFFVKDLKNILLERTIQGNQLGAIVWIEITWRINTLAHIYPEAIIQVPIDWGQFFWRPLSGVNYPGAIILGAFVTGQLFWRQFPVGQLPQNLYLRYVHKQGNGVPNIADDVLCRLRRKAHSSKVSDVQAPDKDFKE